MVMAWRAIPRACDLRRRRFRPTLLLITYFLGRKTRAEGLDLVISRQNGLKSRVFGDDPKRSPVTVRFAALDPNTVKKPVKSEAFRISDHSTGVRTQR
jgi:hypothetical protein